MYLEERDRELLDALAERASVARAEILRLALRRLAAEMLDDTRAGVSLQGLVGALDGTSRVPVDLAARHDEYLYTPASPKPAPTAPKKRKLRASR